MAGDITSIIVDRLEDDEYVLLLTYKDGEKRTLKVRRDQTSRYTKEQVSYLCQEAYRRKSEEEVSALRKERLVLMIEEAIMRFLRMKH